MPNKMSGLKKSYVTRTMKSVWRKKAKILDDGVESYVKYLDNMIGEHQDITGNEKVIKEFKKHADEDG